MTPSLPHTPLSPLLLLSPPSPPPPPIPSPSHMHVHSVHPRCSPLQVLKPSEAIEMLIYSWRLKLFCVIMSCTHSPTSPQDQLPLYPLLPCTYHASHLTFPRHWRRPQVEIYLANLPTSIKRMTRRLRNQRERDGVADLGTGLDSSRDPNPNPNLNPKTKVQGVNQTMDLTHNRHKYRV